MKSSHTMRNLRRFVISCIALGALTALPLFSSARSTNSVNIVNNSGRTIRYVYFSSVNADDWTGDQLGGNGISPGQSGSVNFSCDQQQIKVIGEDQDGCFLSTVVACGADATWTITSNSTADCGQ